MKYFLIVVLFLAACNSAPEMKTQFDNLEKVFETGNWKVMALNDTTYLFFSREGERFFKVYDYALSNGDSVSTKVSTIEVKNGKIIWKDGELKTATENENAWANGQTETRFKKRDSLYIDITSGGEHIVMKRTLPISTFIVRSKYDFLHGTNTANATVDTVRRKR